MQCSPGSDVRASLFQGGGVCPDLGEGGGAWRHREVRMSRPPGYDPASGAQSLLSISGFSQQLFESGIAPEGVKLRSHFDKEEGVRTFAIRPF
jgi:hypothetical protein